MQSCISSGSGFSGQHADFRKVMSCQFYGVIVGLSEMLISQDVLCRRFSSPTRPDVRPPSCVFIDWKEAEPELAAMQVLYRIAVHRHIYPHFAGFGLSKKQAIPRAHICWMPPNVPKVAVASKPAVTLASLPAEVSKKWLRSSKCRRIGLIQAWQNGQRSQAS